MGFISPAVLPPDTRIPVHHSAEGKRFAGDDAPLNKDLADWLKQNPGKLQLLSLSICYFCNGFKLGFVVDYQMLRQQLDETSSATESKDDKVESKPEKSEPRPDSPTLSIDSESSRLSTKSPSVSSKHASKHKSSSRSSTPAHNRTQTPAKSNVSPSPSLKQTEASLMNNPFAALPPNFLNNLQGLPPGRVIYHNFIISNIYLSFV